MAGLPKDSGGLYIGINAVMGALGRTVGPIVGVTLFTSVSVTSTLLFTAKCGFLIMAGSVALEVYRRSQQGDAKENRSDLI